jgi:hypothetical protein
VSVGQGSRHGKAITAYPFALTIHGRDLQLYQATTLSFGQFGQQGRGEQLFQWNRLVEHLG